MLAENKQNEILYIMSNQELLGFAVTAGGRGSWHQQGQKVLGKSVGKKALIIKGMVRDVSLHP